MALYINGIQQTMMPASYPASRTSFNNTGTGMASTNVQDALTELNADLSVQSVTVVSGVSFNANTNGYIPNQSFTVPTGYKLIAVLNVLITDVAYKPVFLRTWYQNPVNNMVTIYWSNTGSSAAVGNIEAELLLKPVV